MAMDDRSDEERADEMDMELARQSNNAHYYEWPEIKSAIEKARNKVRKKMTGKQRGESPRQ